MILGALVLGFGTPMAVGRGDLSAAELARINDRIEAGRAAEEAAKPPTAVFLGDSYTAASSNGSDGEYVLSTAHALGWDAAALGQGGTGYVNPGQPEENEAVYLERVPGVVAIAPDIVVVQGGGNDALVSDCAIEGPASEVFTALREQLPEAQIIALASVPGPDVDAEAVAACTDAIQAAAAPMSIPVIDPAELGWLTDPALFADGFHLTAEGYTQLATLLAEQLRILTA